MKRANDQPLPCAYSQRALLVSVLLAWGRGPLEVRGCEGGGGALITQGPVDGQQTTKTGETT